MEHSTSWQANSRSESQEIPCLFMEPERSFPCSQQPANSEGICNIS